MIRKNTAINSSLGRLMMVCALVFTFSSATVLAADKKKTEVVGASSAYKTSAPSTKKKSSNAQLQKALEFTIPKSMENIFPVFGTMQASPGILGIALGIGLLIGVLSGVFPAYAASGRTIVDGLRRVS